MNKKDWIILLITVIISLFTIFVTNAFAKPLPSPYSHHFTRENKSVNKPYYTQKLITREAKNTTNNHKDKNKAIQTIIKVKKAPLTTNTSQKQIKIKDSKDVIFPVDKYIMTETAISIAKEYILPEKFRKGFTKQELRDLFSVEKTQWGGLSSRIAAFGEMIAYSEGSYYYTTRFGGERLHPDELKKLFPCKRAKYAGFPLHSSGCGKYQFLDITYKPIAKQLSIKDFSPESQDRAFYDIIKSNGTLKDVIKKDIDKAITKNCKVWASLPCENSKGAYKGQKANKLEKLLLIYDFFEWRHKK